MPDPLFVERIDLMAPPGTQAAIKEAARQEGQTVSEWVRGAIRDRLRRADGLAASAVEAATSQGAR